MKFIDDFEDHEYMDDDSLEDSYDDDYEMEEFPENDTETEDDPTNDDSCEDNFTIKDAFLIGSAIGFGYERKLRERKQRKHRKPSDD